MKTYLTVAAIMLGLALLAFLHSNDYFRKPKIINSTPLNIAHRGASGTHPENTLIAVQAGINKGADMIEIDVHMSSDGEAIVIHDATLERTTNGEGEVKDFTTAELQTLDAGSWFDSTFEGEKLPSLAEVLQLVNGQKQLLIELKQGKAGRYEGLEQRCIELVNQHNARSWVILQSFESETVDEMRRIDGDLEIHKLIGGDMPVLPAYFDGETQWGNILNYPGVQAINPWFKTLNQRFINQAHDNSLKVFTWTVNEEEDMRSLIEMGVDGIITNFPERLKPLLLKEQAAP